MDGVDLNPPVERGSFLGLKPQDWLATIGGLLGGARLGNTGIRPFQALFPLAAGLERRDQDTRLRYTVDQLRNVYGKEGGPEFDAGLALVNSGRVAEGVATMMKGVAERNALAREDRKREYETQGEIAAGEAMRPVTVPGIVGFERMPAPPGPSINPEVASLLTPMDPTDYRDFQPTERAPNPGEIIARLAERDYPDEVRGMAHKALRQFITAQALKDSELRPTTKVEGGKLVRYDPRRGTASYAGDLPMTPLEKALKERREQQTRESAALEAKHRRPPPPTPGSMERPHIWQATIEDPKTKVPTVYEFRSYSVANPASPGGIEYTTEKRAMGTRAWRPHAPRVGGDGGVKETQTTVQGVHPEREMGWDAREAIKAEIPMVYDELTKGITPPQDPAQMAQYFKDLEQAVKARFAGRNIGVELRFIPETGRFTGKPTGAGTFSLIRAWKMPTPYSRSSRTVRGPQGTLPPPPPDTGDPDDGDDDD